MEGETSRAMRSAFPIELGAHQVILIREALARGPRPTGRPSRVAMTMVSLDEARSLFMETDSPHLTPSLWGVVKAAIAREALGKDHAGDADLISSTSQVIRAIDAGIDASPHGRTIRAVLEAEREVLEAETALAAARDRHSRARAAAAKARQG